MSSRFLESSEPSPPTMKRDSRSRRTSDRARFLVVARVVGPVGIDGELRAQLLTDFPDRFAHLKMVHVGDNLRPHAVVSARVDGDFVLLRLSGVHDAEAARALRDQDISVPVEQAVKLEPDQFFWHQIIGMDVVTDDGRGLGVVTEVLRTGSNDVYVVGRGSNELLIPAIEDVVRKIEPDANRMIVHLLPGIEAEKNP